MLAFPPVFIVMLVILGVMLLYYLRRPGDVFAGAVAKVEEGRRTARAIGAGLGVCLMLLFAGIVIFLVGANWVVSIIFAAPVAGWLVNWILRD